MSLPKKSNTHNRLSTSPDKSRDSSRPMGQALRANSSEIKADGPRGSRVTFVEDFTLEHSLDRSRLASIEIAGIF